LFKQRFGLRPSDVLASQAVGHAGSDQEVLELTRDLAIPHQWFRSL
jgi:hypothetical protein